MKRNTAFVLMISLILLSASCRNHRAHNINISQTNQFDRSKKLYIIETKLEINNRFGFSENTSIWEDETSNKGNVEEILRTQRQKADSICWRWK